VFRAPGVVAFHCHGPEGTDHIECSLERVALSLCPRSARIACSGPCSAPCGMRTDG